MLKVSVCAIDVAQDDTSCTELTDPVDGALLAVNQVDGRIEPVVTQDFVYRRFHPRTCLHGERFVRVQQFCLGHALRSSELPIFGLGFCTEPLDDEDEEGNYERVRYD